MVLSAGPIYALVECNSRHRAAVSYASVGFVLGGKLTKIGSGLVIKCKSDEFAVFNPPANQTCVQWAGDFVNTFGGYLDNPEDTSACRYCQYAVCVRIFHQASCRLT